MAADSGGSKGAEKIARQNVARRLAFLREVRFVTEGFASNAPVPGVEEARSMAARNARLFASQRPTPSVTA